MSLPTPESIHSHLASHLPCSHLVVEGDGQHFQAVIVSSAFANLSRIARHQLVYGALGERMKAEIHALSMSTLTPEEWQSQSPAL